MNVAEVEVEGVFSPRQIRDLFLIRSAQRWAKPEGSGNGGGIPSRGAIVIPNNGGRVMKRGKRTMRRFGRTEHEEEEVDGRRMMV